MTIEKACETLDSLLKGLPGSGFDSVDDSTIASLSSLSPEAENLGMKSGGQLIVNLADALKKRKTGGNTDDSVMVRVTALDFYVKHLQSGATEDL